eukprot:UN01235
MAAFLWNYVSQMLDYFNIGQYFGNTKGTILFLGLDNAGKSTLFNLLKTGKFESLEPTKYERSDDLVMNGTTFTAYDVGGHYSMRRVWRDHCVDIDGIVFIVDAAEPERFDEVKQELNILLQANELKDIPFLILGNKIDKNGAVNEEMLKKYLGITVTTGKNPKNQNNNDIRYMEVFMCSLKKRTGFPKAFVWLS